MVECASTAAGYLADQLRNDVGHAQAAEGVWNGVNNGVVVCASSNWAGGHGGGVCDGSAE